MLVVISCIAILFSNTAFASSQDAEQIDQVFAEKAGGKAGSLLADTENFIPGDTVCDWTAVAFALNGIEERYDVYLEALEQYVTDQYAQNGCLDSVKATEYHRMILTVLALGGDPESFGEDENGNPVNLLEEGIYQYDGELGKQGINGYTYALLCLDAKAYEVPEDAKYTRESIIESILEMQNDDGGFGLTKGTSDVDVTAMVLHSLAPYQEQLEECIEQGLSYLSSNLNEKSGYASYGVENPESASQVVLALCALGIDPETEDAFCKNGETLLTNIESFRLDDGTYIHSMEETSTNMMATEQALLAHTAVEKLRTDGSRLYDFSNYEAPQQKESSTVWILAGAVICVCLLAGSYIFLKKRRKGSK